MAARAPVLVAIGGLVASGKSSVSRAVAEVLAAERIEADALRDDLLGAGGGPPVHESRWDRAFQPRFAEEVYAELLRRAERALAAGRPVVLDASFPRQGLRERARSLARRHGWPFLFVECVAGAACLRARLAERSPEDGGAAWREIAAELAERWEPVRALAPDEHLRLDTERPLAEGVAAVQATLAGRGAGLPQRAAGVTFDCWNTLIVERSWETAHGLRVAALEQSAREAGRPVSRSEAATAFDAAWERHMRLWSEGLHSGAREVARWSLASLGVRSRGAALAHLVETFEEACHSSRVEALEGARETLRELARAGVRRALVCDTGLTPGRVVRRLLARTGLLEDLEVQVFSDELGFPKPDPRSFRAALEPLGLDPRQTLHVGDLRRTDVAGARGLGMGSVRIRAAHDDLSPLPEADFVVGSHAELRALLRERLGKEADS